MDQTYKQQICDDYYQFTKFHQTELKSIKALAVKSYKLTKCKLSTCKFSDRHYRIDQDNDTQHRNSNDNDRKTRKYAAIYMETMDSLHFYIFHLTTSGMRLTIQSDNDEDEKNEDDNDSSFNRTVRFLI